MDTVEPQGRVNAGKNTIKKIAPGNGPAARIRKISGARKGLAQTVKRTYSQEERRVKIAKPSVISKCSV